MDDCGGNDIMAIIKSGLANELVSFTTLEDRCFGANGVDKTWSYDGISVENMGIEPPPAAPTINAHISGSLVTSGAYLYKFTYYNVEKDTESDPSPASAALAPTSTGLTINIPVNTYASIFSGVDPQVTHVNVYRTTNGGNIYYYDGQAAFTGAAITYNSTVADAALTTIMGELNASATGNTDVNGIPPTVPYIVSHKGRVFGFGGKLYTTGTVTMAASTAVTGSGTAWTPGMKNWWFRVSGDSRKYLVASIESAAGLTLTQAYAGATGAGKTYYLYNDDSILYYSYIDLFGNQKPESFPADYYIPVNLNDGDVGKGLGVAHNQLVIFKKNHYYVLSGSSPADFTLTPISSTKGCVSHQAIANDDLGNLIFPSEKGVSITDGNSDTSISDANIQNIFSGENNPPFKIDKARLQYCHAVFDSLNKRYMLWVSSEGSTITDKCLVYDTNKVNGVMIGWTVFSVRANASAIIEDTDGKPQVFFGDTNGIVYYFDKDTTNDGAGMSAGETRRGTATSGGNTTLTQATATFNTTGDGLKGCWVKILSGTGIGQTRMIASNTGTILTITPAWTTNPDSTSVYAIGYIDSFWVSKVFDFDNLGDKTLERIKAVFSKATLATNVIVRHYLDYSATQSGDTHYIDLTKTASYHQSRFGRNRAKHHQIRLEMCDTDRPFSLYEMEMEFTKHGKAEQQAEKKV